MISDLFEVLRPTRLKIGHFRGAPHSQCLGSYWRVYKWSTRLHTGCWLS